MSRTAFGLPVEPNSETDRLGPPLPAGAGAAGAQHGGDDEHLLEGCRRWLGDRLRGHDETIGEPLARDLAAFYDLLSAPYDACEKKAGWISSVSLMRDRGTDYSVPTAYSHREVLIRGYVDEVMISLGGRQ
jgi:Mu transposase, C-terminal domain